MTKSASVASAVAALVLTAVTTVALRAQERSSKRRPAPFVYIDGGAGGGLSSYGQIHLRVQFAGHHELAIGYQNFQRLVRDVPEDFRVGGLLIADRYPQEMLDGLGLSYGYIHPLVRRSDGDILRMSLRAGLVFGTYSKPGNFYRNPGLFSTNYVYDDIGQAGTGVMLQPGVILTPGGVFGFSAGLYGAVYRDFFSCGIYGSMILGRITERPWRGRVKRPSRNA